jgi:hypothetical protein
LWFTRERSKVRSPVRPPLLISNSSGLKPTVFRLPDWVDDLPETNHPHRELAGGAIGLFAPVGVVEWLLQTEPEDAGILTVFFMPVWCLLLVLGLLIGRWLGLFATGVRRIPQR